MSLGDIDRFVAAVDTVAKGQYLTRPDTARDETELQVTGDGDKEIGRNDFAAMSKRCLETIAALPNPDDCRKKLGKYVHALEHYKQVRSELSSALRPLIADAQRIEETVRLKQQHLQQQDQKQQKFKMPNPEDLPEEVRKELSYFTGILEDPSDLEELLSDLPKEISSKCQNEQEIFLAWQVLAVEMGITPKELAACESIDKIMTWMKEESARTMIAVCTRLPGGREFLAKHQSLPKLEQAKLIEEWIKKDAEVQKTTELNLSHLNLRHLPTAIYDLKNLVKFDCSHNHIRKISSYIIVLAALKQVILDHNDLQELPSMQRMTWLSTQGMVQWETLSCSHNQLTALHGTIVGLGNLKTLILDHNKLQALPPKIEQLKSLEKLELSHNRFQTLPPEASQLPAIKELGLKENPIRALPPEVRQMKALQVSTAPPPRTTGISEADRAVPPWERAMDTFRHNVKKVVGREPDEAILSQSLLRQEIREPIGLRNKLNKSLLAHVHGDTFMGQTKIEVAKPEGGTKTEKLEGQWSSVSLGFMNSFFTSFLGKKYAGLRFVEMVKAANEACGILTSPPPSELLNSPKLFKDKVKEFQAYITKQLVHEPNFILPGGWTGIASAHAMYYEVIKQSNGLYTFRIHNTGGGIRKYHPSVFIDGHEKCLPYVDYGDIPMENLTNEQFVTALLETQLLHLRPISEYDKQYGKRMEAGYGAADIYVGLIDCLGGKPVPYSGDLNEYIFPQHSGTCSWAGLMAAARKNLPKGASEPNFMRFRYDIGLHSLLMFYSQYIDPLKKDDVSSLELLANDSDARMLLQKSVEAFSHDTIEAYEMGMITEQEYTTAYATCRDMLQEIEKANKLYLEQNGLNTTVQLELQESVINRFGKTMEFRIDQMDTRPMGHSDYVNVQWDYSKSPFTPDKIDEQLKSQYEGICKAFHAGQPTLGLIDAVQQLFAALPVPSHEKDDFWAQIPEAKRHACMEQLCQFSELLVRMHAQRYNKGNPTPEEFLAAAKGMVIQHHLAYLDVLSDKVSREILDIPLPFERIELFINTGNGDYNFYDPKQKEQFARLLDYFHQYGKGKKSAGSNFLNLSIWDICRKRDVEPRELPPGLKVIKDYLKKGNLANLHKRFPDLQISGDEVEYLGLYKAAAYALEDVDGKFSPKAFSCLRRQAFVMNIFERGNWSDLRDSREEYADVSKPLFQAREKAVNDYSGEGMRFTFCVGTKLDGDRAVKSWADDRAPDCLCDTSFGSLIKERFKRHEQRAIFDAIANNLENERGGLSRAFTVEDYKELLDFIEGESFRDMTQVPNVLSYFIKNPDKLERIPYQVFFRKMLCEDSLIEKSFATSPLMAKNWHDYLMASYKKCKEEGKAKTACYMLQLAMFISPQLSQSGQPIDLDVRKELTELIRRPNLTLEEKCVAYRMLITSYYPCTEPLGDNDVKLLLEANMFLRARQSSIAHGFADDLLDGRKETVMSRYAEQIRTVLSTPAKDTILNEAINFAWGEGTAALDTTWDTAKGFPLCVSTKGDLSFDVREGTFYKNNVPTCTLPSYITRTNHYQKVFDSKEFVVQAVNYNAFTFKDENGIPTLISNAAIHQQLRIKDGDTTWYQLVDNNFLNKSQLEYAVKYQNADPDMFKMFGALSLYQDYRHWMPVNPPAGQPVAMLLADSSGRLTHKINLGRERQISSVERLPDEHFPAMGLVDIYHQAEHEDRPFHFLTQIDQLNNIIVWKKSGDKDPSLIECPQLGLKFVLEKDEDGELRAKCLNVPGFYIAKEQLLRGMGDFKNFLVLESKNRKNKKVIIPRRQIDITKMRQGALCSKISLKQEPSEQNFAVDPFLTYDVKGTSVASTRPEQNLYLAYLWLGQKQYDKGMACLREYAQKVKAYSKEERQLLYWIQELHNDTLDQDPKAAAAYLCAAACLLANREKFGTTELTSQEKAIEDKYWPKITSKYHDYREIQERATTLQLTPDEERYVLKKIGFSDSSNAMRMQYLEPDRPASEKMKIILPWSYDKREEYNIKSDDIENGIKESNQQASASYASLSVEERLVHPGRDGFSQRFLDNYKRAKNRDPKLLNILRFAGNDPMVPQGLCQLLKLVYRFPERFPAPDVLSNLGTDKDRIKDFVKDLLKPCEAMWKKRSSEDLRQMTEVQAITPPKQRTEAEFKLEKAKPVRVHGAPAPIFGQTLMEKIFPSPKKETGGGVPSLKVSLPKREEGRAVTDLERDLQTTDTDPVIQQTFANARKEAAIEASIRPPIDHVLKSEEIPRLQTLLKVQQAETAKATLVAECQVLELANKQLEGIAGVSEGMRQLATIQKKISINDLLVLSANKNIQGIRQLNPFLSEQEVQVIFQQLTQYLILQTRGQQINRAINLLDDIIQLGDSSEANKRELTNQLYRELTAVRIYDPVEKPEYLLFEYCSDMLLRTEQVANLRRMLYPQGKENPNVILQMIMGAGKTKVLLPILALKNADGEHLSLIVVAESQFGTVPEEISLQSRGVFRQSTEPMHFDRNTKFTLEELQKIHQRLNNTIRNRDYVIMTNKSLACLALKFQEALLDYSKEPKAELGQKIEMMQKILLLFKDKAKAIVDEADTVLDSMRDVIFTAGDPDSLKIEHRELSSEIFQHLFTSEAFAKDFPDGLIGITEETYNSKVKNVLIDSFVARLITEGKPPLGTYLKKLKEEDLKNGTTNLADLKEFYLSGKSTGSEARDVALQKMVDAISDVTTKNLLALMKEQFTHLLPLTLSKQCDVHYGFSHLPNKKLAVPYLANNTPNESSQFGNPYELLNYTLLTYHKKGVPFGIIKTHMDKLREQIIAARAKDGNIKLENIPAYNEFRKICGVNTIINPFKYSDAEIQTVADTLNKNKGLLMDYVKSYVLPDITIYPMQLTMNSQGFIDMFHQTQGFTGTPWNKDTMHQRLETIEAEGTDGITLNLIKNQCEHEVHELPRKVFDLKASPAMITEGLVDRVIETQAKDLAHFKAIIDTGSLFNGIDNESVARALLKKLKEPIKGICFYKGDQRVVLERGKENPVPFTESLLTEEERFTYYDQRHCTGEDIRQAPLACAAVTVGKDLKFRDLAQGAWRMRGLINKGQRISLVFSAEAGDVVRQNTGLKETDDIQLKHILQHVHINQGRQLGRHCITAAKQKVHQVMEAEAMNMLLHTPIAEITPAFNAVKNVFVSPVSDSPFAAFGRREQFPDREDVMADRQIVELERLSPEAAKINPVFAEETMKARMSAVTRMELLPKKLPAVLRDQESRQFEVEMEVQKEMQREVQMHAQPSKKRTRTEAWPWHWKVSGDKEECADIYSPTCYRVTTMKELAEVGDKKPVLPVEAGKVPQSSPPIFCLRDLVASSEKMGMAQDFFDDDILASYNYVPMKSGSPSEISDTFLNAYQIPTRHRLVIKPKDGPPKTILISQEEAVFFYKELAREQKGDLELYLIDKNVGIIQCSPNGNVDGLNQDPAFQRQMFKLDLLDCDFDMPQRKEAAFAASMPTTKEAAQHTKDFFEQFVVPRHPSKLQAYRNSRFKEDLDAKAAAA